MHVAEILRDASPKVMLCPTIDSELFPTFVIQGKHVAEIAKPTKADHGKLGMYEGEIYYYPLIMLLARILRLLATNHIFTEVSPDVFANNRLSSVLDTGNSVEELLAKLVLSIFGLSNE